MLPLFVTVDTEGDNGWDRPRVITTENANGLSRFQSQCEKYGIKPVYLMSHEMAVEPLAVSTLKGKNHKGLCEIGMHMHPWTALPSFDLTGDDFKNLPFVTEYPENVIRNKVATLTEELENYFEENIISHRAGRWVTSKEYLGILLENGYKVDCSYTPLFDWTCSIGDPFGHGGNDYRKVDKNIGFIEVAGGELLEIPLTTRKNPTFDKRIIDSFLKNSPASVKKTKVFNYVSGRKTIMLRPDRRRKKEQLFLIDELKNDRSISHVELIIHSSEVYKGTCPHCKTDSDVDSLYSLMDTMFKHLVEFCQPMTFKEYLKNK